MDTPKNGHTLSGKLLVAMPGLDDPRFHRAVIFMCAHDEKGAMGLVINHILPGLEFKNLVEQLAIPSDSAVKNLSTPVMAGGPVENARGFILHSPEFRQKDTVAIGDLYAITGTIEAMRAVAAGNGPEHLLFILGYAGWGAGQLDREIQDNSWLVADADPDIIFRAAPEEKWELSVQKIGVDPAMLSLQPGHA